MTDGKGERYNAGKTRHDLVPPYAQEQYAKVITLGAEKYAPRNWERGMSWTGILASLERHILAFKRGEDYDPETGLLHLAHAMCNVAFLLEFYKTYPQGDDRPKWYLNQPRIALDVDEVLCDFVGGWIKRWDIKDRPQSWFFDRDITERFRVMEDEGELDDFYMNLEPLIDPASIPFEPIAYVTSRPISSEVTAEWLDRHGFPTAPVYTVGREGKTKVEILKDIEADTYVDDRFDNFVDITRAGILCYLIDAAHNQRYDVGFRRIKELSDIWP